MDVRQLKTFLAVAETSSFHRAAQRLNVTQAAVSARIKALEEALDTELFLRGPGGTRLSEAGESLRPHAEQLLAQWAQVVAGIGRQHGPRIALRLGCQLSIWDERLLELSIWAEETLGRLPLALNFDHETNALDLVRGGFLDLTLTHERPSGGRLTAIALEPEEMILVADRPCRLGDGALPIFLNLQLGPAYDAYVARLPGAGAGDGEQDSEGHFILGHAAMGLAYLLRRGGMGLFPRKMVAEPLVQGRLHEVTGATRFPPDALRGL